MRETITMSTTTTEKISTESSYGSEMENTNSENKLMFTNDVAKSNINYHDHSNEIIEDNLDHINNILDMEELQQMLTNEIKKLIDPHAMQKPMQAPIIPPAPSIGTQININNLNIDLGSKKSDDQQCLVIEPDELEESELSEHGNMPKNVLSKIVKNFFGEMDRRKYKGKYKNSPMVIKLFE